MTLIKRLYSLFTPAVVADNVLAMATPRPIPAAPTTTFQLDTQSPTLPPLSDPIIALEPLPGWLSDDESVRDEGILFGLSNARPDEKVASIRAYFSQQAAVLDHTLEHHTEKISELNLLIGQRETRINELRNQISDVQERQPASDNLIRTIVSLYLSVLMCVGNFYLIDETLRPVFSNQWIAVGVFLAGMFTIVGSGAPKDARLTGRQLVETVGLPLATAVFVLAQAVRTQPVGQSIALFFFVFLLFLLSGNLLLSTLTTLRNDLSSIRINRQTSLEKRTLLPKWETQIDELNREIDALRMQKWPVVTALTHTEANLTRLNAQRDGFVTLFLSEFELARSLRDRLTEQQRKLIMTGSPERL